jgi:RNA polymerase subunit RPABC4/transcription elongation factor Spt4
MAHVNGKEVERPEVSYNLLVLNLTQENSTLSITFNSSGTQRYSHEVPKNVYVENFSFFVEIRSITDDDIDLTSSLSPNDITTSKNSIMILWDNMNTIMRKDIVIDIPLKNVKTEDSRVFLLDFIYGLAIIGPLTAVFYHEGLKRVKHERHPENGILLSLPYIFLIISLVTLVFWIGISTTIATSMIGFALVSFFIKKRALKVESGFFGFYLIPFLPLTMLIGVIIWEVSLGAILIMISSLLLIVLLPHFLLNHPREVKDESVDPVEDREVELKENEKITEKREDAGLQLTKKQIIDKNFCPFCKSNIESDFGFCPACGKEVASIVKCKKCGILRNTSSEELYCPNCGSEYQ